jgi:GT2 family glycosyltransferase
MNNTVSETPRISVIIVNWNGLPFLADCLDCLARQERPAGEIIVVDNASQDGSREIIRTKYPRVRLIENSRNLGFAAANNQGIEAATGDLIATINNDVFLRPGWLRLMEEAAAGHPDHGMFASTMLFLNRPGLIASAGIEVRTDGVVIDRLVGLSVEEAVKQPSYEVFGPSAGAAVYRRSLLADTGLFDADYFAYLEDADLAWRARLKGWRCLYVPSATSLHRYSASSGQDTPFKSWKLGENRLRTIIKDMPAYSLKRHALAIGMYDFSAVVYGLASGNKEIARGRVAALHEAGRLLAEREKVQGCRRITDEEFEAMLQPRAGLLKTRQNRAWLAELLRSR